MWLFPMYVKATRCLLSCMFCYWQSAQNMKISKICKSHSTAALCSFYGGRHRWAVNSARWPSWPVRVHRLVKFMSHNYLLLVAGGRKLGDVNSLITRMKENEVRSNFMNEQHHKSSALPGANQNQYSRYWIRKTHHILSVLQVLNICL